MPTSTKKRKSRPPVGRKPKNQKNGGPGGAIARLASNVRPTKKNTRARKPSNTRLDRVAAGAGMRTRPLGLRGRGWSASLPGPDSEGLQWRSVAAAPIRPRPSIGHRRRLGRRLRDVPAISRAHKPIPPSGRGERRDPKGPASSGCSLSIGAAVCATHFSSCRTAAFFVEGAVSDGLVAASSPNRQSC